MNEKHGREGDVLSHHQRRRRWKRRKGKKIEDEKARARRWQKLENATGRRRQMRKDTRALYKNKIFECLCLNSPSISSWHLLRSMKISNR